MTYYLQKMGQERIGDSGAMSMAIVLEEDESGNKVVPKYIHNSAPIVGGVIRVGSLHGRTYASQDWWQTSVITEILSETKDERGYLEIIFKTVSGSTYKWGTQDPMWARGLDDSV